MSILDYLDWRHIFNWAVPPLTKLEKKIFEDAGEYLDTHRRNVLFSNLEEVNRRTWGFEGSEAWYYKIRRFKICLKRADHFKIQSDQEKLFSGILIFPDGKDIKFNIYALDSRLSHVTFSSDPRKYQKSTNFKIQKVRISE